MGGGSLFYTPLRPSSSILRTVSTSSTATLPTAAVLVGWGGGGSLFYTPLRPSSSILRTVSTSATATSPTAAVLVGWGGVVCFTHHSVLPPQSSVRWVHRPLQHYLQPQCWWDGGGGSLFYTPLRPFSSILRTVSTSSTATSPTAAVLVGWGGVVCFTHHSVLSPQSSVRWVHRPLQHHLRPQWVVVCFFPTKIGDDSIC